MISHSSVDERQDRVAIADPVNVSELVSERLQHHQLDEAPVRGAVGAGERIGRFAAVTGARDRIAAQHGQQVRRQRPHRSGEQGHVDH